MIHSTKRKFSVFAIAVLLIFTAISEADSGAIILNPTQQKPSGLRIYKNAFVKISNTFNSALYNLTVIEYSSEKRVLSIADFQSGESFEMSFSKAGEYKICYSSENDRRTCLLLDVLKAELI